MEFALPEVGRTALPAAELITPERALTAAGVFIFSYFWVATGGVIGTLVRFWLSGVIAQRTGETFPFCTLAVNVTGCFVAGFFVAITGPEGRLLVSPTFRQFFLIGVCGG